MNLVAQIRKYYIQMKRNISKITVRFVLQFNARGLCLLQLTLSLTLTLAVFHFLYTMMLLLKQIH